MLSANASWLSSPLEPRRFDVRYALEQYFSDHRHPKGMWPTSNKQIHQKLMDQYDEKLPEMFADGSEVTNPEKAVLHMDLNYNLRIGFLNEFAFGALRTNSIGLTVQVPG